MRYDITFDELAYHSVESLAARRATRGNAAKISRRLDHDQYGFLVTEWNRLDPVERGRRADYCASHKHRYVAGPYPGFTVCNRCLVSVGA